MPGIGAKLLAICDNLISSQEPGRITSQTAFDQLKTPSWASHNRLVEF